MRKASIRRIIISGFALIVFFSLFLTILSVNTLYSSSAVAESTEQAETGTLNYSDGSTYSGDILYGRIRNGVGTFSWSTGESYTGTWVNDVQEGTGEMIWPELGVYNGHFYNGKREGTGVFTWTYDGDPSEGAPISYEGDWTADQIGPKGKLVIAGIGTYDGEFVKQARHGEGTFTWLNGDVYQGTWANDTVTGVGILTLADGTILEGTFAKGILNKGTITYSVSGGTAVRPVQSGKIQASITITYQDGTVVSGKLKGVEFTGNVEIKYGSGDKYVGTLRQGIKDGKGTYTWTSGAHYVGEWAQDKMSGNGKYYYGKDETMLYLSGTFKNGKPSGTLIYVSEKKLKYQTTWSNGSCVNIVYKK